MRVRSIRFLQPCNLSNFPLRQYALAAVLMLTMSGAWSAANAQQMIPVTKCSTVINAPGVYVLAQSLKSTSPTQDCIQISSPGVVLLLRTYSITGPSSKIGTSAGIRVLSTAYGAEIRGGTIQNFGTGVVIEGSGVTLGDTAVTANVTLGILVNNASGVVIDAVASTRNGTAGIEIAQSTAVTVRNQITLESNGTYGLWVNASSNNQFSDMMVDSNGRDGIFVGETANDETAQDGNGAANVQTSQRNVFLGGGTVVNSGDGIRIGNGDTSNYVVGMQGYDNIGTDAADGNGNCTDNTWADNFFSTKNPSCIQ